MIRPAAVISGSVLLSVGALAAEPLPVTRLLQDGYEVKAAFNDNTGGAYIVLQKATSAYLCHSSPNQTCEKLN